MEKADHTLFHVVVQDSHETCIIVIKEGKRRDQEGEKVIIIKSVVSLIDFFNQVFKKHIESLLMNESLLQVRQRKWRTNMNRRKRNLKCVDILASSKEKKESRAKENKLVSSEWKKRHERRAEQIH